MQSQERIKVFDQELFKKLQILHLMQVLKLECLLLNLKSHHKDNSHKCLLCSRITLHRCLLCRILMLLAQELQEVVHLLRDHQCLRHHQWAVWVVNKLLHKDRAFHHLNNNPMPLPLCLQWEVVAQDQWLLIWVHQNLVLQWVEEDHQLMLDLQ